VETVEGGWAIYRERNASICWLKTIVCLCNWWFNLLSLSLYSYWWN